MRGLGQHQPDFAEIQPGESSDKLVILIPYSLYALDMS